MSEHMDPTYKIRGKGAWSYFGFLVDVGYQNIKLDLYAYSTISKARYDYMTTNIAREMMSFAVACSIDKM